MNKIIEIILLFFVFSFAHTNCNSGEMKINGKCKKCKEGTYSPFGDYCFRCDNCKTCNPVTGECLTCYAGDAIYEKGCHMCSEGSYSKDGWTICLKCNGCDKCNYATGQCLTSCQPGFYPDKMNFCIQCPKKTYSSDGSMCIKHTVICKDYNNTADKCITFKPDVETTLFGEFLFIISFILVHWSISFTSCVLGFAICQPNDQKAEMSMGFAILITSLIFQYIIVYFFIENYHFPFFGFILYLSLLVCSNIASVSDSIPQQSSNEQQNVNKNIKKTE